MRRRAADTGGGSHADAPRSLQFVHLYFERGSPKAVAARRWLVRYLSEGRKVLDVR